MDAYQQDPLTDRELDIVCLLAQGLSDREIAERLVIAPGTVRWYNKQIYGKLHVGNRTQAARRARELGLLPAEDAAHRQPPPRHNLPVPLTPLVGRKQELSQLAALLGQDDIRLITVLAPGGMGKTRLALEAVRSQIGSFLHGVHYIPLEGVGAARHIVPAVAQRLGLQLHRTTGTRLELLHQLRDRWLLLLFDGFEEVLEGKEIIRDMLTTIQGLKVLVTSRAPLMLQGETLLALDGLTFPSENEETRLGEYGSVALFLQGARRMRPDYDPDEGELATIGHIGRIVQGMPLAIVMAASWMSVLSPAQIRTKLEQNLSLLHTDTADVPERQRSIQGVFNHAMAQIPPELKAAYEALAVCRGSFTRDAAVQIGETTLAQIAALSDHALLSYEPAADRYSLHALLQRFALDALSDSDRLETARRRHMDYYLKLLKENEADLKGGRQLRALRLLDADFENLRAAWRFALSIGDASVIATARDSLFWFCQMCGRIPDGEELMAEAHKTFQASEDRWLQRQLLIRFNAAGDDYRAELERALVEALEASDAFEIALLYWALGVNGYVSQAFGQAVKDLEHALELFTALDEAFYATEVLHLLGFCSRLNGDLAAADAFANRALKMARASGNKIALARALGSQAVADIFRGDLTKAEQGTREALALRKEYGDAAGVAMSKASLGFIALLRGSVDKATSLARDARDTASTAGHASSRETANTLLGWIASLEEDYERGRQLCESSLEAAPDPNVVSVARIGLAFAACGLNDFETARMHLDKALPPTITMFGARGLLTCLPPLAMLSTHDGKPSQAVRWLAMATTISEEARPWASLWPATRRLLQELENELGAAAYASAWEVGLALAPVDVAATLGKGQAL